MYFSVLGPLQIRREDGTVLPIRGVLRRTLLGALLLNRDDEQLRVRHAREL